MSPKPLPPERLEKRLARVARETGVDQERLRRWVSFLALCGVLERAVSEQILDVYHLKGGVAMELRFGLRARATKDLDLGIIGNRSRRLAILGDVSRLTFDEFSFRLKAPARQFDRARHGACGNCRPIPDSFLADYRGGLGSLDHRPR